jgi:hypothetical protein
MQANRDVLEAAIVGFQAQIKEIEQAMTAIRAQLVGSRAATATAPQPRKRSKFSAAARRKMAAAQKARWEAYRKAKAAKA